MNYFSGSYAGPISGHVNLPAHPPVTGVPVSLGGSGLSFTPRIGQLGVVNTVFGIPEKPSWLAGIGFGVGSAALITGSFFFPPGIPFVSGSVRVGLLAGGAYLAYRSALHFIERGRSSEQQRLESFKGFIPTPVARPEELDLFTQIIDPQFNENITYRPYKKIPVFVRIALRELDPRDSVNVILQARLNTTVKVCESLGRPTPITIMKGIPRDVLLEVPHTGFICKLGQAAEISIWQSQSESMDNAIFLAGETVFLGGLWF